MQFLTRVVDLAIVNLMTVVVMIPVITTGPALAAMNNALIHMVRQDGMSPWKQYRKALKQNMRQGIGLGLIFLGAGIVAGTDLFLLHRIDSKASTVLMIIITVISICAFVIGYEQGQFINSPLHLIEFAEALRCFIEDRPASHEIVLLSEICQALIPSDEHFTRSRLRLA